MGRRDGWERGCRREPQLTVAGQEALGGPEDTSARKQRGSLQVISQELDRSTQQTCVSPHCGEQCNQPPAFIFSTTEKLRLCLFGLDQKACKRSTPNLGPTGRELFQLFSCCGCGCCSHRSLLADRHVQRGFLSPGACAWWLSDSCPLGFLTIPPLFFLFLLSESELVCLQGLPNPLPSLSALPTSLPSWIPNPGPKAYPCYLLEMKILRNASASTLCTSPRLEIPVTFTVACLAPNSAHIGLIRSSRHEWKNRKLK